MLLLDAERFPEIHSAYVQIGASGNPRQIQVTLDVGKPSTRDRTSQEIARAAIEAGEAIVPEMQARRNSEGGPSAQPVLIEVYGDDLDALVMADVYYTVSGTWRDDVAILARTPFAWLGRRLRRDEGQSARQWYGQIAPRAQEC